MKEYKPNNGIDFKKLTPKMQTDKIIIDELYKKALYESVENDCEYSKNTTTWD